MLVNQIISMKPSGDIITIGPEASVADAVRLLSDKRIGAVVVSRDGKTPMGILSERDIVREMSKDGAGVLERQVSDLMTSKLVTCSTGEDAMVILEQMTNGRFRHMPVVNNAGEMVGIISIGDVVSARLKELSAEKEALTGMIMGN
ncbi:CBS domain-containing protein [Paracoccus halophilus]|uniref:CBS domain-containing protein n=1 Tax=Paracoccus halophilus TaxID=376733 RepID=A0A099F0Z6_9RHOB|nr:CBS domain-containing protein [Paracoccus halophilus]KGJ04109.1 histidine kinase [Paracoccus halophilus]SFA56017.1 CBS domain-containing protein [Paracoccus halophilus]